MERRRRFEFDFRDRDEERGYRRVRLGSGSIDDDRDSLPEWCLEDAEEEMGTFDSSGAFLSLKVRPAPDSPSSVDTARAYWLLNSGIVSSHRKCKKKPSQKNRRWTSGLWRK